MSLDVPRGREVPAGPRDPRVGTRGAKDARSPNATRALSLWKDDIATWHRRTSRKRKRLSRFQRSRANARPDGFPFSPRHIAAAATDACRRCSSRKQSGRVENEKEKDDAKKKPHWASPSREYVKARSPVDAFATPFAKAETRSPRPRRRRRRRRNQAPARWRLIAKRGRRNGARRARAGADTRGRSRAAMRAGAEEAERRAGAETPRLRDALTKTDAELLRTRAELRAASNALAKSDAALTRERLGMARGFRDA